MVSAPHDVRFEHRPSGRPALGIGTATPRLSWRLDPEAGAVTDTEARLLRTTWTGEVSEHQHRVPSDAVLVAWPGAPLGHLERVEVSVRVATGEGWSAWSEPAVVEAGPTTWTARLVSPREGGPDAPAPVVGTVFEVPGEVASARLLVSAHGIVVPHVNGRRAGDEHFTPGWTAYAQRLRWTSVDVTELVRPGTNEVDLVLGNGWWRGNLTWFMRRDLYGDRLGALAQLEVRTTDGRTLTIASDEGWHVRASNVLADDFYCGQVTDLRLPALGPVTGSVEVVDFDPSVLVAAEGPPVREVERVPAQQVWRSPAGKLLVDFGQNVVGWVRLRVADARSGTRVTVRHAEVLEHEELGTRPLRHARATDEWLLPDGDVVLEPSLTFHGFRYAEVEGLDALAPDDIEAVVLSSDLERTGWFSCSHPLVNQLHANVVRGMRGNFLDVPTDCPQRDERLGWTGDIQVFSPTALHLFDAVGFLSSWCADLACEQSDAGSVPFVVPDVLHNEAGAAAWGDAATIVPWNLWWASGDAEVLRRQLPSMQAWVAWVAGRAQDFIWRGDFQFGDWLDPDAPSDHPDRAKADPTVCATALFFRSADLTARAAEVLGEVEVATRHRELANQVRDAFRASFVDAQGRVTSDCQTVYALAICWGLVPDDLVGAAGIRLSELVQAADHRIGTGFIGTPLVCEALTLTGHHEDAVAMLEQTECPSWLYPVTMGATTIWERWDSMSPDGSINPGEMTSFNHYALGAVADWLHQSVAGLRPAAPGWRRIVVEPLPGGSLTQASTSHLTPRGEASVAWELLDGTLQVEAVVPWDTVAEVVLPGRERFEVGPGVHQWAVDLPANQPSR